MRAYRAVFLLAVFFTLCMPLKGNCATISEREAPRGMTDLMEAARKGDSQAIQTLLDNGADIHARDKYDNTALLIAVLADRNQDIQLLLDNKAVIHAQKQGGTALMLAATRGHSQAIKT